MVSSAVGKNRSTTTEETHLGIVIVLIVLALIFGVLGAVIEGLFWLLIIGLVLLVGSAIFGFSKRRA